jgi:TonB family protein
MSSATAAVPDVFSAREIARAAGVPSGDVRRLIAAGEVPSVDGRFVTATHAVAAVRRLRGDASAVDAHDLFAPHAAAKRSPGRALAASGAMHGAMVALVALITSMGVSQDALEKPRDITPVRLVFLATPGPGGGGGGGGLKQPAPPPKAQMKGASALKSPVPPPRPRPTAKPDPQPRREIPPPPVRPKPVEKPAEPPPAPPAPEKPMPQVVAPVVTAPSDARDRPGVLTESTSESDSNGPGSGGGVGTGTGTGIGEGDGSGIGPGSGGGTGGGPYRPGSGITPPGLLREVRPDYTEEARRRGVEGDVVVEVVVKRDGTVGDVRLLQGLGAGLDQRAIDAVRQWRFSPARRYGTPVDVMVEVAVEFKLR